MQLTEVIKYFWLMRLNILYVLKINNTFEPFVNSVADSAE